LYPPRDFKPLLVVDCFPLFAITGLITLVIVVGVALA